MTFKKKMRKFVNYLGVPAGGPCELCLFGARAGKCGAPAVDGSGGSAVRSRLGLACPQPRCRSTVTQRLGLASSPVTQETSDSIDSVCEAQAGCLAPRQSSLLALVRLLGILFESREGETHITNSDVSCN